jgi:RNase P subunit RPR2
MIRAELEKMLLAGNSANQIGKDTGKSVTAVLYWMKKHGLAGAHRSFKDSAKDYCCPCGEVEPAKFYGHKKRVCSECHKKYTLELGHQKRARALEQLGGKCMACGFNKHNSALDIHHTDPTVKDPNFANMRSWKWEKIEKEISTCILLCRNCHSMLHVGAIQV